MSIKNLKTRVKTNYSKSPRTVVSATLLGVTSLVLIGGVLTGVIEPETAVNLITRLVSVLTLGA